MKNMKIMLITDYKACKLQLDEIYEKKQKVKK